MLTNNDISFIHRTVADQLYKGSLSTADATPVTILDYELTSAEVAQIEVICTAMKDSTAAFVSRMAKTFFYDGTTAIEGGWWGYITKEYLGAGLSTCDFSFVVTGNVVSVVWTGEAATDIQANFRVLVHRMVNTDIVLP